MRLTLTMLASCASVPMCRIYGTLPVADFWSIRFKIYNISPIEGGFRGRDLVFACGIEKLHAEECLNFARMRYRCSAFGKFGAGGFTQRLLGVQSLREQYVLSRSPKWQLYSRKKSHSAVFKFVCSCWGLLDVFVLYSRCESR